MKIILHHRYHLRLYSSQLQWLLRHHRRRHQVRHCQCDHHDLLHNLGWVFPHQQCLAERHCHFHRHHCNCHGHDNDDYGSDRYYGHDNDGCGCCPNNDDDDDGDAMVCRGRGVTSPSLGTDADTMGRAE